MLVEVVMVVLVRQVVLAVVLFIIRQVAVAVTLGLVPGLVQNQVMVLAGPILLTGGMGGLLRLLKT